MRRLKCAITALALLGFPGVVSAQGVNGHVTITASMQQVSQNVEATAWAGASFQPAWITLGTEVQGGGHYSSDFTEGPYSQMIFLTVWAEPDTWYEMQTGACADADSRRRTADTDNG
jgi:hypothetical protein